MASNLIVNDAEEMRRSEEERRKRPDVQRYKPGAFNRKPEPLFPEGSFHNEIITVGTGSAKHKENRRGGQGTAEKSGSKDKRKKPDKEHFMSTKVHAKVETETSETGKDGSKVEDNSKLQDTGGGGLGTRRRKSKKGKSKDKPSASEPPDGENTRESVLKPKPTSLLNGSDHKPIEIQDKTESKQNDDLPSRNMYPAPVQRTTERKERDLQNQKPEKQGGKEHEFRVPDAVKRNYPEKRSDRRGGNGSLRGHGSDRGGHGSDRGGHGSDREGHGSDRGGHCSDRRGHGSDRGGHGSDRGGHVSDRGAQGSDRGGHGSDRRGHGSQREPRGGNTNELDSGSRFDTWERGGGRTDTGFQRSDRGGDFRSQKGFSGSERSFNRSDRDIGGPGFRGSERNSYTRDNKPPRWNQDTENLRRGDSEPKDNGQATWSGKQDQFSRGRRRGVSRGSSPQRGLGRWSRGSSPSRNSRGNSPNR